MAGYADKTVYTKRDHRRAVNLSAVLGWVAVIGTPFLGEAMKGGIDASLRSLFMLFALFGIPLAFVIAWIFVAPTLRVMMRRQISYTRAVRWGAAIGLGFVVLSISVGRFRGWRQSLDPTFHSQIGGGDHVRSVDDILTPYCWEILAQDSVLFILQCILAALVIRTVVGPGNPDRSIEAIP